MLRAIAPGVHVHESEFLMSNTVVVEGDLGVLLIDPGITTGELEDLGRDLQDLGKPVVAGFSTHPDWDHVLWHESFGDVPRLGTAECAASIAELRSHDDWPAMIAEGLPPEHADEIPMALLGRITGLAEGTVQIPWDGPTVRILEHRAHAPGHAALLIEGARVLVAGDMLSDILMPFLDLDAPHPIDDYLDALTMLEGQADAVETVVPGHGAVGGSEHFRTRIQLDRAYVERMRDVLDTADPRVSPGAPLEWLPDVHRWQVQRLTERGVIGER